MSKFETFAEYPPRSLAAAEAALLTIWPALNQYHEDLVLVGGLAVHYLTRRNHEGWPGAVTMDVDFGIALGAAGGQYGTIQSNLGGLGFGKDGYSNNRLVRRAGDTALYVDFLTEAPETVSGSRMVDDVVASVFPGIDRALTSRRLVRVTGRDVYDAKQSCEITVADIGPLLVLKLNAFGGPTGRRHPKDAYDILLAVTEFADGPEAAINGFHKEGYATAIDALRKDFCDTQADGAIRAAEFLRGRGEEQMRIREEMVTVGRFLLSE